MGDLKKYVSCDEYCRGLDALITESTKNDVLDTPDFPWDRRLLSDHLPVVHKLTHDNIKLGVIITWNVLNRKYIKHLIRNEKNDNQRLGNHPIASTDLNAQMKREFDVSEMISRMFAMNEECIVCLQEVSHTLLRVLSDHFSGTHFIFFTHTNAANPGSSFDNCDVVLAPLEAYSNVKSGVAFPPEIDPETKLQSKSHVDYFTFQHKSSGTIFNVLCVHMPYGSDYVKFLLELPTEHITVVAGDFNRTVRYPVAQDNMHMQIYSDERFRFPNPKLAPSSDSGYSHVCKNSNIGGDPRRMLDRIDHIMIVDPKN